MFVSWVVGLRSKGEERGTKSSFHGLWPERNEKSFQSSRWAVFVQVMAHLQNRFDFSKGVFAPEVGFLSDKRKLTVLHIKCLGLVCLQSKSNERGRKQFLPRPSA